MRNFYLSFFLLLTLAVQSQQTYPVNGTEEKTIEKILFVNAHIIVNATREIKAGAMLVNKGKIIKLYEQVPTLDDAKVIDLAGQYIYPAFIEPFSEYGQPNVVQYPNDQTPQFISKKDGAYYWNEAIHPEIYASEQFHPNPKEALKLRSMGIGLTVSQQCNGIFKGTSCLVNTSESSDLESLLVQHIGTGFSFYKGNSRQDYPRSQMGSIALIRQSFYDAKWYGSQNKEVNLSLKAINDHMALPKVFEVKDAQDVFRVMKIAKEFNLNFIIKATGEEYKWLSEFESMKENLKLILPLDFSHPPAIKSAYATDLISTDQLHNYYQEPFNAKKLLDAGVAFCFTTDGLKSKDEFFKALRTLKNAGLSEAQIIAGFTSNTAAFFGLTNRGELSEGMEANFFTTDVGLFEEQVSITSFYLKGKSNKTEHIINPELLGSYSISIDEKSYEFELARPITKPQIHASQKEVKASVEQIENPNSLTLKLDDHLLQLSLVNGNIKALLVNDLIASSIGVSSSTYKQKDNQDTSGLTSPPFEYRMDFNYADLSQNCYLIQNATVWTCEDEKVLENTSVLVKDGKIVKIGNNISAPKEAVFIDAQGMHLSPGIIDEHSHIAIYRGVNEGTQAVTSEVRIGDVINAEDINIYRQLAGGVTTSHLLHGSANPIGGQTELIKLRYGASPEGLKYSSDFKFIKFALGENVKQTNWGDHQNVRYPQTRMGVEQVFTDAFTRGIDYQNDNSPDKRIDLELEAISEILKSNRFITCHSYQQGEINMLMHVADSFGFTVNTFTHVLEGYKIADKLKEHGASASTFADWWAYKFEVNDAIPYNAAIMTKVGVLTAINSDDAEMGRRLNQEAAKTIKYGGLTETQALNLVTINPAKMLHIDDRVGSIKVGKDADLVLWTDNPLSIYANVYITFVDGVIYYHQLLDEMEDKLIQQHRTVMISKIKPAKKTAAPKPENNKLYHCDDDEDEVR